MPEGDTVHLAAARLHQALGDKVLRRTEFRVPRFATADVSGRRLQEVIARGKHLLFRIDGGVTLHTHFKMEGSWHLYRHGEAWRGPAHQVRALLETDDRVAVGFRLAITELIDTGREDEVTGHLGPDVLGPDWDADEAVTRLQAEPDREIGEALLDQRVLAGVGNVYKCEICFLRGIWPRTLVRDVPDLPGVVGLAKRLMEANRTTGQQITTGDRRPGRKHWVYGRAGKPCLRCRSTIAHDRQMASGGERITFWCPRCQTTGRPTSTTPSGHIAT
ncbi:MAG: DNA glycosylase [Actinomycetota bacterium]|nr:DNA glycosylase [Actinomycetota bacterium]